MLRPVLAALMLAGPAAAQDAAPRLSIELNALDARGGACRLVFVARNGFDADITALVLETVAFDPAGGVAAISLFDFADLPAGLPRVRQFDLPGLACGDLGSLLVNGVATCEGGPDCAAGLSVSSRVDLEFLG